MTAIIKSLLRNTILMYSAELISNFFLFIVFIFAARIFGVRLFGEFSFAITIFFFLQIISDFGFSVFLTKEVARNKENPAGIFRSAFYLKTILTTFFLCLFILYLYTAEVSNAVMQFVLISGLSLIFSSYSLTFILTLRGLNNIKLDSFIRITGTLIATVCSLLSLGAGLGMPGIAYSIAIGNLSTILLSLWINRKYNVIVMTPTDRKFKYAEIAKKTFPFWAMAILTTVYTRIDTVFLQHIRGPVDVGLYHASSRIVEAALLLPSAFSVVLIPVLSSLFAKEDIEDIKRTVRLGIKYMTYTGIFCAVITFMLSDKIIEVLYFSREYREAVIGLKILSLLIFIIFVSSVAGSLILSSKIAHVNAWINLAMVILSVTLNLILIPRFGFTGSASIRVFTEIFGLCFNMIFVNKMLFPINYFSDIKKPLLAGLVVAGFISVAASLLFLPVYFLIYLFILYIFGGISPKEFAFVKELLPERRDRQ